MDHPKLTNNEVVTELKALTKPYIGIMAQASFSQRLIAINNGTCKPITMIKFFEKFGYAGSYNEWIKKGKQ